MYVALDKMPWVSKRDTHSRDDMWQGSGDFPEKTQALRPVLVMFENNGHMKRE